VGVAVGPDGALYVSDWVDKSYTLHKMGRVWRISAKHTLPADRPADPREAIFAVDRATREEAARALSAKGDAGRAQLEEIVFGDKATARVRTTALGALWQGTEEAAELSDVQRNAALKKLASRCGGLARRLEEDAALLMRVAQGPPASATKRQSGEALATLFSQALKEGKPPAADIETLLADSLASSDPFVRQAARHAAIRLDLVESVGRHCVKADDAKLRLEGLLIFRDGGGPTGQSLLPSLLVDVDPTVRFSAVQWVGEQGLVDYRPLVEQALVDGASSRQLFEGCLAALELLKGIRREQKDEIGGDDYVAQLLVKPETSATVRGRAIRMVRSDHPALTIEWLSRQLREDNAAVVMETVRTLRERAEPAARELVLQIASDPNRAVELRAEAIVGLSGSDEKALPLLLELATGDGAAALRDEALRALRAASLSGQAVGQLEDLVRRAPETAELVARVSNAAPFERPANADVDAWMSILDERNGDAVSGERVFYSSLARCSVCHQRQGRGGKIGPELTPAFRLTRRRLVESILEPSKEIAPQFTGYTVATLDGRVVQGLLVREDVNGVQAYMDDKGQVMEIHLSEIAERAPQKVSLMPENLPRSLTLQEFRDLLAYLQREE
jgi:putative heme-binding domain-containing protein